MMKKILLPLLIIPALASATTEETGPTIDEGLWEITTEMNTPSIPEMNAVQKTQRQCITNKNLIPDISQKKGQQCKTLNTTIKGDTVSWTIECDNNGNVTKGKGKITYKKNKMYGGTSITISNPLEDGELIKMDTEIKGRRLGDC